MKKRDWELIEFGIVEDMPQDSRWKGEPDFAYWIDKKTKLKCCIIRQGLGHLCGYVGVDKSNKLYGKKYHSENFPDFSVHWGVTFSDYIKKVPDNWFIGFDCAHCEDFQPKMCFSFFDHSDSTYKNFDYVLEQTESLALQISEFETILSF